MMRNIREYQGGLNRDGRLPAVLLMFPLHASTNTNFACSESIYSVVGNHGTATDNSTFPCCVLGWLLRLYLSTHASFLFVLTPLFLLFFFPPSTLEPFHPHFGPSGLLFIYIIRTQNGERSQAWAFAFSFFVRRGAENQE